jgi:hypothetical protein
MVFLKHFDTSKQTLLGAGKAYMLRTSKVSELAHVINERMRWTPGTPLKLYEASFFFPDAAGFFFCSILTSSFFQGNQTGHD